MASVERSIPLLDEILICPSQLTIHDEKGKHWALSIGKYILGSGQYENEPTPNLDRAILSTRDNPSTIPAPTTTQRGPSEDKIYNFFSNIKGTASHFLRLESKIPVCLNRFFKATPPANLDKIWFIIYVGPAQLYGC